MGVASNQIKPLPNLSHSELPDKTVCFVNIYPILFSVTMIYKSFSPSDCILTTLIISFVATHGFTKTKPH